MSDTDYQGQTTSLRDVLYVLFRHKWKIIIFVSAVFAVAGYLIKAAPDVYQSDAKLFLIRSVQSPQQIAASVYQLNTEVQFLRSHGFAEAVVDRVGPEVILNPPPGRKEGPALTRRIGQFLWEWGLLPAQMGLQLPNPSTLRTAAARRFAQNFLAESEPNTTIISLSYMAYSAKECQQILEGIVAIYTEKYIEMHTASYSFQVLGEQTDRLGASLANAEHTLSDFRDKMSVTEFEEQQKLLLQRIEGLQSQIQASEADYSGAQAGVATTAGRLGLRELEQQERVRLASLQAKLNVLRQQLKTAQTELSGSRETQRRLGELEGDVEKAAIQYKTYQSSLEQARIQRTLEAEQMPGVGVLETPTYPNEPKRGHTKMAAAAALAGILGGVAMAFLLERLNRTIRSPADIGSRLKLSYISSLPQVDVKMVRRRLRSEVRRRHRERDALVLVPMKLAEHAVTWLYFVDEVRDCFEELRNRLELGTKGHTKRPYVLAITSCYRGEGVSTVAAGLAYSMAFANKGEAVLVIKANGHHKNLDIVPGQFRPPGLFELDVEHGLIEGPNPNLQLFRSRGMNDYLATMGGTKAFNHILPSVQRLDYKFVILDLPSLREGGVAPMQAGQADGTLLVIESERVTQEAAQTSIHRLEEADAHVVGAVLNKRRYYIPNWLYRLS